MIYNIRIVSLYQSLKKHTNMNLIINVINLIIMSFTLPVLPYSYDALEPHIDAQTMAIHYTKHHQAYVTNLNNAVSGSALEGKSLEELLKNVDSLPVVVRNNAGGHWNHTFFWNLLSPKASVVPTGKLAGAINKKWGNLDAFKAAFNQAAMGRFGSGWAWLCVEASGELEICSTANQDNPLMPNVCCSGQPILGLDVWEHAYYLKYQNRRAEYVEAFWKVLDWKVVENKFEQLVK